MASYLTSDSLSSLYHSTSPSLSKASLPRLPASRFSGRGAPAYSAVWIPHYERTAYECTHVRMCPPNSEPSLGRWTLNLVPWTSVHSHSAIRIQLEFLAPALPLPPHRDPQVQGDQLQVQPEGLFHNGGEAERELVPAGKIQGFVDLRDPGQAWSHRLPQPSSKPLSASVKARPGAYAAGQRC